MGRSSFDGIHLRVQTHVSVRKQSLGVPIRAAGAKGDYLVVSLLLPCANCCAGLVFVWFCLCVVVVDVGSFSWDAAKGFCA